MEAYTSLVLSQLLQLFDTKECETGLQKSHKLTWRYPGLPGSKAAWQRSQKYKMFTASLKYGL